MKRTAVAVMVALATVGCSGSDEAVDTTTTAAPETTTTLSREQIGLTIADAADPTKQLGYMHDDPEALAVMAGQYCADLDTSDSETASQSLEESLTTYIWRNGQDGGNRDKRVAAISAGLTVSDVVDVATGMLCPGAGSEKYLPPA